MTRVSDLKYITTQKGRQYELIHPPLGQGGQGVVFRCAQDPELLFKLVLDQDKLIERDTDDPSLRQKAEMLNQGLEEVKLLSLPASCHVAVPQDELHTYVGYSMRMLQDMAPISTLIARPGSEIARFYIETGGLRRRLTLLHNLAKVFQDLHSRGICYGDLSPENAYISTSPEYHETWLIDADNMRIRACDRAVYTPWYGAPEVISGQRFPDMRSDCYTFALLAWHIIAQVHPFMGSILQDEDDAWDKETLDTPDDGDSKELEVQQGLHPWIHDQHSDANRTSAGITPALVCSRRLIKLFHQTFEQGRLDPSQRPSISQWIDALQRARMNLIACPSCQAQYYHAYRCPWCQSDVPLAIQVESRLWMPEIEGSTSQEEELEAFKKAEVIASLVCELPEDGHLHIDTPLTGTMSNAPRFELMYHSDFIYIENKTGTSLQLIKPDTRQISLKGGERFECVRGAQFWLHCGELDEPHRYLTFKRL